MNLKINNYKIELSRILNCNPQNLFLYWKGRVALYAALKSIGIKENDEIILPAFTCVVVPNAILYLKAKPVYVEIDLENYSLVNISKNKKYELKPLGSVLPIVEAGGIFEYARKNNMI